MTTDPQITAARIWLAVARDKGLQVTTYGGFLYVIGEDEDKAMDLISTGADHAPVLIPILEHAVPEEERYRLVRSRFPDPDDLERIT
jgi:hypothetical protein